MVLYKESEGRYYMNGSVHLCCGIVSSYLHRCSFCSETKHHSIQRWSNWCSGL